MINSTTAKRLARFGLGLVAVATLAAMLVGYWWVIRGLIVTIASGFRAAGLGY